MDLKALREQRGLSQAGLGILIGVSRTTVYNWEAGLKSPGIGRLSPLSRCLGVSVEVVVRAIGEIEAVDATEI